MKYGEAIQELEQKRDYCIAAIAVLKKLSAESGEEKPARNNSGNRGKKRTPEHIAKMRAGRLAALERRRAEEAGANDNGARHQGEWTVTS